MYIDYFSLKYSSVLDCDTKWWKVFFGIGYKQVVGGYTVNNEF